jgi:hypothetical protein
MRADSPSSSIRAAKRHHAGRLRLQRGLTFGLVLGETLIDQPGTNSRYAQGCRCDDCREGHKLKAREYSQRKAAGQVRPRAEVYEIHTPFPNGKPDLEPGPVEAGVQAEIVGVADVRPGLAATALALARLLDDPTARNQAPAAAKALVGVLDKLRSASACARRGHLAGCGR